MRRRLASEAVADDPVRRALVHRLSQARLVSVERDSIVLAHESIATAWPALAAWLDEEAGDAETMGRLAAAADAWVRAGQSDDDLYRGARLRDAQEFTARADPALTTAEAEFLAASANRDGMERAAATHRAHRDRVQNRRLRAALTGVSVLVVIALVAAGAGVLQSEAARRSAEAAEAAAADARIEATVGQVSGLRSTQRHLSALIAAELYRRDPDDPRSRAALMTVLTDAGGLMSTRYVASTDIAGEGIPGRSAVIIVRDGSDVEVHDLVSRSVHRVASGRAGLPGWRPAVAVTADGGLAAVSRATDSGSGAASAEVTIIDLKTSAEHRPPIALPLWGPSIALSDDGRWLASVDGARGVLSVADLATGAVTTTGALASDITADFTAAGTVVFAPTGELLLGSVRPVLTIVDPRTLEPMTTVPLSTAANADSAVTADGVWVGAGEVDVTAVDLASRTVLWHRPVAGGKPTSCVTLTASRASDAVFCGDPYGGIDRRSLTTGEPDGEHYDPQLGASGNIAITGGGYDLVAFGGSTPTVTHWRLDGSSAIAPVIGAGHVIWDGYDSTGHTALMSERAPDARTSDDFHTFTVWDAATDKALVDLPPSEGAGWVGDGLLTGYSLHDERIVYFRADTGSVTDGDPIPLTSERLWPGTSGSRAYHAFADGTVRIVDAATRRFVGPILDVGATVVWVSADPRDAELVAVSHRSDAGEVSTTLFDAESGTALAHGLPGATVTEFVPDGTLVAAVGGKITVHDSVSLDPRHTLAGARGEVNSLQVSGDGRTLLATSNDGTIALYDLGGGGTRLGDPIPTSAPLVVAAYLRPDGAEMLVDIEEGVQRWDMRPDTWFDAVCRLAGRELTDAEWQTFFPGDPRNGPTCPVP